jgi:DNA adenine methylase
MTKPFLKWVGGKTQIIEQVVELFPSEINNYYEPFIGGGSVLLAILNQIKIGKIKLTGKIYASDINQNLIYLYENIQTNPEEVINETLKLVEQYNSISGSEVNRKPTTIEDAISSKESYYYWIRTQFNSQSDKSKITNSAMMLFLNKTCFRGLYREGPNGFNVPYGNYTNPTIIDREHILEVSELIKDVIFNIESFTESLLKPIKGDFIYMDPPYAPENDKSFVSYNSEGFNQSNIENLFKLCNNLTPRFVKFLMSNSDVKIVNEAFPEPYKKIVINCKRSINSKNPESKTNELLIKNY